MQAGWLSVVDFVSEAFLRLWKQKKERNRIIFRAIQKARTAFLALC